MLQNSYLKQFIWKNEKKKLILCVNVVLITPPLFPLTMELIYLFSKTLAIYKCNYVITHKEM